MSLFCLMILVCGIAWSAPDRVRSEQYQGDQLIASGPRTIYGLIVNYKGVTAGDKVEIKDGLTSAGTVDTTIYAPAANGSTVVSLLSGISLDTGIYLDETATGGQFTTDIQYQ